MTEKAVRKQVQGLAPNFESIGASSHLLFFSYQSYQKAAMDGANHGSGGEEGCGDDQDGLPGRSHFEGQVEAKEDDRHAKGPRQHVGGDPQAAAFDALTQRQPLSKGEDRPGDQPQSVLKLLYNWKRTDSRPFPAVLFKVENWTV